MRYSLRTTDLLDAPTPNLVGAGNAAAISANMAARARELAELAVLMNILENALSVEGTVQGHDVMDAMQALVSAQKQLSGRKTVVFFSQGLYIPDNIVYRFRNLISHSNLSNVSIYAVDARGVTSQSQNRMGAETLQRAAALNRQQVQGGTGAVSAAEVRSIETALDSIRMNVQETLDDLSRSTGGFLTANTNDPREAMERLVGELQRYYEVAYIPAPAYLDSGYRKITVKVDRPSVTVQSRDGFFPLPAATGGAVRGYEVPLLESLGSSPRPRDFPLKSRTFHFESRSQGVEQIMAAVVPAEALEFREDRESKLYSARLSMLALVKTFDGEVVLKKSREFPLEGPSSELEVLRKGNVAFIEGFTLQPGRYYVEVAAHDQISGKSSAVRKVLVVMEPGTGTSISSLLLVAGLEPVSSIESYLHSPLKHAGHMVIPRLGSTVDAEKEKELVFYCVAYPPGPTSPEPDLTVAVYKDGQVLFRGSPDLDDAGDERMASLFSIPIEGLSPGTYQLRAWAQSGESVASESALFTIAE
jgi:VWFA-related protein